MKRVIGICIFWTIVILAGAFLYGAAFGQERGHPQEDEGIHDVFYQTWMRPPGRTVYCCGNNDCAPAEVRKQGGRIQARSRHTDGKWVDIPEDQIEQNQPDPRESPDGRSHLCVGPAEAYVVYCFTFGAGT